jgi:hypothetical protein
MIWRQSEGTFHQYIKRILSRYSVFIRAPENKDLDWTAYTNPFGSKPWLSVAAAVPIFAILLSTAQYSEHILRHEDRDSSEAHFTFCNSIFYIFGAFCQQGKIAHFIHFVFCLRLVHSLFQSEFPDTFSFQYTLLSLRQSSSCLRLLSRLRLKSIFP